MVEILDFETLAWISQRGSQMCRGFICGLVDHMTDLILSEMKNLVWGESEDLLLIDELCVCVWEWVCVCVCVCVCVVVDILPGAVSGPDTADIPHPS